MNLIQHVEFIIKLFILGAVPWIFLSKESSLYFKTKNLELAVIFNCFASLFGTSIYLCIYYSKTLPAEWLKYSVFIYAAIILSIIYFILIFLFYEFANDHSKKDDYFEIKRLEIQKDKTADLELILKNLKTARRGLKTLIIAHFVIYILIFSLLGYGLGVSSLISKT
jgi:hypothetical protein